MWQLGLLMFGLAFPDVGYPFETNTEYKLWCWENMEKRSSKRINNLKKTNTLYTAEFIEIIQRLLTGKLRPKRKYRIFSLITPNEDFDETPYRLSLNEALKITNKYRNDVKYKFKEWVKEDYYTPYLNTADKDKKKKD